MKVVVTGGTGFVGRHLVWRLAAQGMDVLFTGRSAAAAQQVLSLVPSAQQAQVRYAALDHADPSAGTQLQQLSAGAGAIIHCAALSSPWGAYADFYAANVQSTAQVIGAAKVNQTPRVVHISTPSVYFAYRDQLNVTELAPLPTPVNTYAATKRQAETLLLQAQLPELVMLRPRAVFGPWDQTLMPRLLRVMQQQGVPLMRGGKALLDVTCVANLADAVWLALTKPLPRAGAIYNVSNGEPQTVSALLAHMASAFELPLRTKALPWPLVRQVARLLEWRSRLSGGAEPAFTQYSAGVLAFSQTLDLSAIRQDLGYQPRQTVAQGLAEQAQWWKEWR